MPEIIIQLNRDICNSVLIEFADLWNWPQNIWWLKLGFLTCSWQDSKLLERIHAARAPKLCLIINCTIFLQTKKKNCMWPPLEKSDSIYPQVNAHEQKQFRRALERVKAVLRLKLLTLWHRWQVHWDSASLNRPKKQRFTIESWMITARSFYTRIRAIIDFDATKYAKYKH